MTELDLSVATEQLEELFDSTKQIFSDVKISDWAEAHRIMTTDVSPWPGPFTFDRTPYFREIADTCSPNHPARVVTFMKGAQIGASTGVIENIIGWIIDQNPGNILFLTGHEDLAKEAMDKKVDQMIESCGLKNKIRATVKRRKNQRTGDTSKGKEFAGGSLTAGATSNHKLLRQRSVKYLIVDDFDAAKKNSKQSGSTMSLVEQRAAAYYDQMKMYLISTPEVKATSNIEPAYLKGDQRKWHVPCPCCGDEIVLEWSIPMKNDPEKMGGITWQLDDKGRVIRESVGYVCQSCGDFFDESKKMDIIRMGRWIPTAEPQEIGWYSYHLSALYATSGMADWAHYVTKYVEAFPVNQPVKPGEAQAFYNLCLGLTYENAAVVPESKSIQRNTRDYKVGLIPTKMSDRDGNGRIVMLTCACDLNGKEDDARADWEIVAWSESGSSYSVMHGSIGTFQRGEGQMDVKPDRLKWTYRHQQRNCVWPEFEKIIHRTFATEEGKKMGIMMVGVDTGHFTDHAYTFVDNSNHSMIFGMKGNKAEEFRRFNVDMPVFKPAIERKRLWLLDVNYIKDRIDWRMRLKWNSNDGQPSGFMNFPMPESGLYGFKSYFEHFEGEHKVEEGEGTASLWMKKNQASPNHFWDVSVYNYALKELWAFLYLAYSPKKKGTWQDAVTLFFASMKK